MAATKEQPRQGVVDIDQHQAELERRAAEREEKRKHLQQCLGAEFAASQEAKKPLYEYTVFCRYSKPTTKGLRWYDAEEKVNAQCEPDAWAQFCDKVGVWPSPTASERNITKGKKVN